MKKNDGNQVFPRPKRKGVGGVLKKAFLTNVFLITFFTISAQNVQISLSFKETPLKTIFYSIEKQSGYNFLYSSSVIDDTRKANLNVMNVSVKEALDTLFNGTNIRFKIAEKQIVLSTEEVIAKGKAEGKRSNDETEQTQTTTESKTKQQIEGPIVVKGVVRDSENNILPGATLQVKGTNTTAITDADGKFSIKVDPMNPIVVVSFVGMKAIEVDVYRVSDYNFFLQSSTMLNEVVVTGVQVLKKVNTTGSFASVKPDDLKLRSSVGLNRLLEGSVPGLSVYREKIQIRGASSMNAGTEPLYVVDGFEVASLPANLNDVESVTVLKDAAAAAIWGSRAANGVVVITSKKGRADDGEISINYTNSLKVTDKYNYSDLNRINSADLIDYEKEAYDKGYIIKEMFLGSKNGYSQSYEKLIQFDQGLITKEQRDEALNSLAKVSNKKQIDKYLLRNAFQQDHYLSISGGNKKLSYIFSGSFNGGHTSYVGDKHSGGNLNSRTSYAIRPFLTLRSDISTSYTNYDNGYSSLSSGISNLSPYQLIKDDNGNYIRDYSDFNKVENERLMGLGYYDNGINLLEESNLAKNKTKSQNYRTKVGFDLKLIKGMELSSDVQFEKSHSQTRNRQVEASNYTRMLINQFTTEDAGKLVYNLPKGDIIDQSNSEGKRFSYRSQLSYNRYLDDEKHYINAVVGAEVRNYTSSSTSQRKLGYNDQLLSWGYIDQNFLSKTGIVWWDGSRYRYYANSYDRFGENEMREQSFYASLVYTYDSRYNFSTSYRTDESNLFGVSKKYRRNPLWSIGGSWNVNKEKFFNIPMVNQLKVRTSYGLTGNFDRSGLTTPILTAQRFYYAPSGEYVARISTPPNPKLRWERTKTLNLGVDVEVLDRYFASVEIYNKNSYDLLGTTLLDPTVGFPSAKINAANMTNKGIEVTLRADVVKVSDFIWTSSLNFSYNKNEITKNRIADGSPEINRPLGYNTQLKGYPRESLWSYKWAGLDEKGNPQTYDANGNKTLIHVFESLEYNGTTVPKVNGSFTNSFSYRGMQLMFNFVYNLGHKLRIEYPAMNPWESSNNKLSAKRWRNSGDEKITDIPSIGEITDFYDGRDRVAKYSSNSVIDGSFVRLREVMFTYQLPGTLLKKTFLKRVAFTAQANNLFLWTKNSEGVDPEAVEPILGTYGLREPISFTFGVTIDI